MSAKPTTPGNPPGGNPGLAGGSVDHPEAQTDVPPVAGTQGVSPDLGGENVRGEVLGCPTGLADHEQVQQVQRPGGGGAPGTGTGEPGSPPYSPGEGVTEEQMKQSGRKD